MNENINIQLAREKGLINNDNIDEYIKIANLYKYLFEQFLNNKINIKEYDNNILNSDLDFGISKPNTYQKGNNLNDFLKNNYIYILNSFFIEKLSIENISILKNTLDLSNITLTPELEKLIEQTYDEIIKNNYINNNYTDELYEICYGDFVPSNFALNDALVLKIFYGKNKKQMSDEDYLNNLEEKQLFLNDIIDKLQKEINQKLNVKVKVLVEKIPN